MPPSFVTGKHLEADLLPLYRLCPSQQVPIRNVAGGKVAQTRDMNMAPFVQQRWKPAVRPKPSTGAVRVMVAIVSRTSLAEYIYGTSLRSYILNISYWIYGLTYHFAS